MKFLSSCLLAVASSLTRPETCIDITDRMYLREANFPVAAWDSEHVVTHFDLDNEYKSDKYALTDETYMIWTFNQNIQLGV
jgi:hypothetical protein